MKRIIKLLVIFSFSGCILVGLSKILSADNNIQIIDNYSPKISRKTKDKSNFFREIDSQAENNNKTDLEIDERIYEMAAGNFEDGLSLLHEATENCSAEDKLRLYGFFVAGLASVDPLKALEWSRSIDESTISSHCSMTTFSVWLQDDSLDIYKFLDKAKDFKNSSWINGLLNEAIRTASSENEDRSLEWITKNLSGDEQLYFQSIESVFRAVGKRDPQQLFQLARDYEIKGGENEGMSRIVFGIASEQVSSALTILEQWPGDENSREQISNRILQSFFERDIRSFELFLAETYPDRKNEILAKNVSGWIGRDASGFENWLSDQDDHLVTEILKNGSAVTALGVKSPEKSAAAIQKYLPKSDEQVSSLRNLVSSWSYNDPIRAIGWLEKQPESMQREVIDAYVQGANNTSLNTINEIIRGSSISQNVKNSILKN